MKRICAVCVAVLTAGSLLVAAPNPSRLKKTGVQSADYMPGVVIVKMKAQASRGTGPSLQSMAPSTALSAIMQAYSATGSRRPFFPSTQAIAPEDEEFSRIYEVMVPSPVSIPEMVRSLKNNPAVEYAEPKLIRHTTYQPNDPLFSSLSYLNVIKAPQAWDVTKNDSSVVIGIVDSGTDYNHPDLAADIYINKGETGLDALGRDKRTNGIDDDGNGFIDDWHGWDFIGASTVTFKPDNDPNPYNGNTHGTHTAGIASAVTDNNIGVSSMGYRAKLMITKHGGDSPGDDGIYNGDDGILYCINNGANVVSCSWGGAGGSQYEEDIVKYALKKNVLIVASAGNDTSDLGVTPTYPGAYLGVLSVGATDLSDVIAYYSNYGAPNLLKVLAPGNTITSTLPGGQYGTMSGTSMAAPIVSGLAAQLKGQHPSWSAAQIMFQITGTADNIDATNPKFKGKLGYGRINAYRAVTETVAPPPPDFTLVSISVDDSQGGNGNGILEPGEQASLIISLENHWGDASNVTVTASTSSIYASLSKPTSSYGFIRGIANIDSAQKTNAADPIRISINSNAIPAIVPITIHVTASNGVSKDFQTTVPILPSVFLVDDDDGQLNVESYYINALTKLGVVYDRWDHSAKGTPPIDLMMRYKTLIWFTEWNVPTLDSSDRAVLTTYLNSGGKHFFLSGEENGWDLCDPTGVGTEYDLSKGASKVFYETYLKGKFVADDAGTMSILGVAGDEIGDGLSFIRNQPGRDGGQNPDVIDPANGGLPIFTYAGGPYAGRTAGVKYKGNYSLVSFSFGGYESITDSVQRQTVMDRVLKYLLGYSVTVGTIPDNQDPPYTINASVTTTDPNPTVQLLWTINGQLPYQRMTMTRLASNYTATILPSPSNIAGKDIEYFILVKTTDGYLPYTVHTFKVNLPASVTKSDTRIPTEFSLSQNFPNPFNPSTEIRFSIAQTRQVVLTVYDVLGRNVATLVNEVKQPGDYTVNWNAGTLTSGVYFYRLEAGSFTSMHSMILVR